MLSEGEKKWPGNNMKTFVFLLVSVFARGCLSTRPSLYKPRMGQAWLLPLTGHQEKVTEERVFGLPGGPVV